MAIAFRAVGNRLESTSGGAKAIPMPAGVVSGDLLVMMSTSDCRNDEGPPTGWTYLMQAGRNDQTSATPWPKTRFFWKIATGSEGASQTITYSTASYPNGSPTSITYIVAYSGTHQTAPIVDWEPDDTTAADPPEVHPQLTVTAANSWLVSVRGVSADAAVTFTISGGSNTERVDDSEPTNELSVAYYDTNGTVSTGLQTQRTTTSSGTPNHGSNMSTFAIRPPTAAGTTQAPAAQVAVTATALNATVTKTSATDWATICSSAGIAYQFAIDWAGDGSYADSGDVVTDDVLSSGGISIGYGRDQSRQLSPRKIGTMTYGVNNSGRKYSPENTSSVLFGNLDPARDGIGQVTFSGVVYPLFKGRIDDFTVHADWNDRTVDFGFLDAQAVLQSTNLSTPVRSGVRTGNLIGYILDLAGWTGPRDIDPGATVVSWWWAEGTDAYTAIQDLVASEGPPSIAYQAPDGTFVFRDRHHRLLRTQSQNVQGTFASAQVLCTAPAVTGLSYTPPFTYEHGWRDIVNSVNFDVEERSPSPDLSVVWSYGSTLNLSIGESRDIDITGSDPFIEAQVPTVGTDFTLAGPGTAGVGLSRLSGASIRLTLTATGGPVVITDLQLRARAVPVRRTIKVSRSDTGSITQHGTKEYPNTVPWAGVNDAYALAGALLDLYAQRRPMIQLRITASTPTHFQQVLSRTVSDRIHVINGELGLDSDFFVESVTHQIDRIWSNRPPVHSVILGCEKDTEANGSTNPFTFDKRGAGFDDGVFDPLGTDNPNNVFVFDDLINGRFDYGQFGT